MDYHSPRTGVKESKAPMAKGNSKGNFFLHSSVRGRSHMLFYPLVLEREYRDLGDLGAQGYHAAPPALICKPKLPLIFFEQKCL